MIAFTNTIFGALDPTVDHVYSTHGEIDPWRPMGVQEHINANSPTFVLPRKFFHFKSKHLNYVAIISGESHVADLYSASEFDSPFMAAHKMRIFALISRWLGL